MIDILFHNTMFKDGCTSLHFIYNSYICPLNLPIFPIVWRDRICIHR